MTWEHKVVLICLHAMGRLTQRVSFVVEGGEKRPDLSAKTHISEVLNVYGMDGWEVVAMANLPDSADTYQYVLKRQVQ